MIDHVAVNVSDYDRSRDFYAKALEPIGYSLLMEPVAGTAGSAARGSPNSGSRACGSPPRRTCTSRSPRPTGRRLNAFHAAALEAGGTDNGEPGLREDYHPTYYGAFVRDPDGNNIEVVCHKPE